MPHAPGENPPPRRPPTPPPPRVPTHDTPPPRRLPARPPAPPRVPTHDTPPPTRAAPPTTTAQQGVARMLGHHAPDEGPQTPRTANVSPTGRALTGAMLAHAPGSDGPILAHLPQRGPVPLAVAGPIDVRGIWNALSSLPPEGRANVIDSLPGVNTAQRAVVNQLEHPGQNRSVGGFLGNLVKDALHTPQGIFLGTYTLGHALGSAAGGNTTELRNVAGAMASPFTSTKRFEDFAYNNPFQLALTASAAGRAAGAATGALGRTGAIGERAQTAFSGNAPRVITRDIGTREATDGSPITRSLDLGTYSKNAWEQAFQRGTDRAGFFNARAANQARNIRQMTQTERDVAIRDRVQPVVDQTHKTKDYEQTAAIYAHAQGLNPSDLVTHYTERVNQLQHTIENATGMARSHAARDLKYAQNALRTWQHVHDKVGDLVTPAMRNLINVARQGVAGREGDLLKAKLLDPQTAASSPLQPSGAIPSTSGETPFYVHNQTLDHAGVRRFMPKPTRSGAQGPTGSTRQRSMRAMTSGNMDFTARPFVRNLAEPDQRVYAINEIEALRGHFGHPVEPGDQLKPGEVLMPRETVTSGDPGTIARSNILDVGHGEVPDDGVAYVAVPKSAVMASKRDFNRTEPGLGGRATQAATRAFKWDVLLTRPAWLASNVVGNTAQAALGGAGLVSFYRALDKTKGLGRILPGRDYGDVIPQNAQNAGLFARQFAKNGNIRTSLSRLPGNPLTIGNVTHENWVRRAVYLRHALPKYGHDINALTAAKTAEERAPVVVKVVDRFLGNFAHGSRFDNVAVAVPFIRWLQFITNQTLHELPVHHPGRALLIYRLGALGNLASAQAYGLPNESIDGGIPLPGTHGKGPLGPVSWVLRTGALNPWATVSQLGGFSSTEPTGMPGYTGAASSFNPFAQAAYSTLLGHEFSNPEFSTVSSPTVGNQAAFFANQLYNMTPAARLMFGNKRWGQAPLSPPQQPQAPFWMRLFGYNVAGISPVDLRLMNTKNLPQLASRWADERR